MQTNSAKCQSSTQHWSATICGKFFTLPALYNKICASMQILPQSVFLHTFISNVNFGPKITRLRRLSECQRLFWTLIIFAGHQTAGRTGPLGTSTIAYSTIDDQFMVLISVGLNSLVALPSLKSIFGAIKPILRVLQTPLDTQTLTSSNFENKNINSKNIQYI